MYRVTCNDYTLYDYRTEDYELINPKLKLEANKVNELSFKIYDNHPNFKQITKLKSIVKVYQKDKLIFRGRVLEDTQDFDNAKQVDVECQLAFLLDSVYRPFDLTNQEVSVKQFLTDLIDNHNSQVQDFQKIQLGNITVEDPNGKINFSSESALKTWDIIDTRLIKTYGGYLNIRYDENEMPILDYLVDFDETSTQTIEFGKNMLDISHFISGADIATAVIPYGAKIKDSEGNDTNERLTIKDVNGGIDYIYNEEMVAEYGFIFAEPSETTWDDVTTSSRLLTKAREHLSESIKLNATIELKAVDLSNVYDIESFKFCDYIKVMSAYHSIDKTYLLSKIEIDLLSPQNTIITLGETYKTISDTSVNANKNINNAVTRIEKIEKDYVANQELVEVKNEVQTNISSIIQNSEAIVFGALEEYVRTGNFEEYKELVETQFAQTARDFTFLFDTAMTQVNTLSGETHSQFQEQQKYIRFEDGNIIIGVAGNELTLVQKNDRISFIQNNHEVAYFSNNKLTVTDGEFLNSLRIGKFAFRPRANGSLSFGKVSS